MCRLIKSSEVNSVAGMVPPGSLASLDRAGSVGSILRVNTWPFTEKLPRIRSNKTANRLNVGTDEYIK